jgi:hypothetical protein
VYADSRSSKNQVQSVKIYETNESMHSEPNPDVRSQNNEEVLENIDFDSLNPKKI